MNNGTNVIYSVSKMVHYESRRAILEEIGKKAQEVASNYLTWVPDYDDKDFNELWQHLRAGQAGKKGFSIFTRVKKPPKPRSTLSAQNVMRLNTAADMAKSLLRLRAPVTVPKLRKAIVSLAKMKKEIIPGSTMTKPVTLQYPLAHIQVFEGLDIWIVDAINFKPVSMETQKGHIIESLQLCITLVSLLTNSHPALCLAFLLSDIPIYTHTVNVVVDPFQHVNIYVREPAVPMWLIGDMYQMTREQMLSIARQSRVDHPKPRVMSERVSTLLEYVEDNSHLSWEQRLDKWNEDHGDWKYKDKSAMQVVYYRAKPKSLLSKGGKINEKS